MSEQNTNGDSNKDATIPEIVEMNVAVGEGTRRLPIYFLLDTSGSMAGTPNSRCSLGSRSIQERR